MHPVKHNNTFRRNGRKFLRKRKMFRFVTEFAHRYSTTQSDFPTSVYTFPTNQPSKFVLLVTIPWKHDFSTGHEDLSAISFQTWQQRQYLFSCGLRKSQTHTTTSRTIFIDNRHAMYVRDSKQRLCCHCCSGTALTVTYFESVCVLGDRVAICGLPGSTITEENLQNILSGF